MYLLLWIGNVDWLKVKKSLYGWCFWKWLTARNHPSPCDIDETHRCPPLFICSKAGRRPSKPSFLASEVSSRTACPHRSIGTQCWLTKLLLIPSPSHRPWTLALPHLSPQTAVLWEQASLRIKLSLTPNPISRSFHPTSPVSESSILSSIVYSFLEKKNLA